jgi:hypothetical protein
MNSNRLVEALTIPNGARVVAMNPDVAQKIRARIERDRETCGPRVTMQSFVAKAIRNHLLRPKTGDEYHVRNKRKVIELAMGMDGTKRIGAFEQPDQAVVVVVMPVIAALLGVVAAEDRNHFGWLGEFAIAITLAALSDYEKVVLQAQKEVGASRLGMGPLTAAMLATDLGVGWIPPVEPLRLEFNRVWFVPFQEYGERGPVEIRRIASPSKASPAELFRV